MANYEPALRSNTFRVKNRDAFSTWIESLEGELDVDCIRDEPNHVVIYGNTDLPSHDNEGEEIDFLTALADHLIEQEVAIIFGIGNEKLRYLAGFAFAVHSGGETIEKNLNEIYREAAEAFIGRTITEAW